MSELFLGRARLRRDAVAASLAPLLVPQGDDARAAAAHRLVWALFADDPARQRDFLWREDAPGALMTLSSRPPADPHGLFDLDFQPFAPSLAAGDRLGFRLRANPTISRSASSGKRGARHDVVMDALRRKEGGRRKEGERREARPEVVIQAGRAWLAAQGARHGFTPDADVAVDGYDQRRLPRPDNARLRYSVVDFEGVLTVDDPQAFLPALAIGFGRAKAFGCGLMLIRRAR